MQVFIIAAGVGRGRILCEWVGCGPFGSVVDSC